MAYAADEINRRTVTAHQAMQSRPELKPFMQPVLSTRLAKQSNVVAPLLSIVSSRSDSENDQHGHAEITLQNTHDLIQWVHDGVRYRYRQHSSLIIALVPLRLGRDEAENEVRLSTLVRELPRLKPIFPWLPEDGLTLAAVEKQLKEHQAARKTVEKLSGDEKDALRKLREARAESYALWSDDDGRLEAWIIANVPEKDQYAFGRERRQRPRAAKPGTKDKVKETGAGGEKEKPTEASAADPKAADAQAADTERKTG